MITFGAETPDRAYLPRPSAYGIVQNPARQVLVVESSRQKLYLPGGGLLSGETAVACLAREFREETGFTVQIGRELGEAKQIVDALGEPSGYTKHCRFFRAEILARGRPTEIGYRIQWLDRCEASVRLHEEAHRWALSLR